MRFVLLYHERSTIFSSDFFIFGSSYTMLSKHSSLINLEQGCININLFPPPQSKRS